MRNKILHDLAASPSSINEFIRYKNKVKREVELRRIGAFFLFVGLAVFLFAYLLPPEKSSKHADNNLLSGLSTKTDLLQAWDNNTNRIADIYSGLGVTRDDLFNLTDTPNDRLESSAATNYWVATRTQLESPLMAHKNSERVTYSTEDQHVSLQPLNNWHEQAQNFESFKGRLGNSGKPFWIIAGSGNFVQIGRNISGQPPAPPVLKAKKTIIAPKPGQTSLNQGDKITYRLDFQNSQSGTLAENVKISDRIPLQQFDILAKQNLEISDDGSIQMNPGNIPFSKYAAGAFLTLSAKSAVEVSILCQPATVTTDNSTAIVLAASGNGCSANSRLEQVPLSISQKIYNHRYEKVTASSTTSYANDTLEYELSAANITDLEYKGKFPAFYIGDILDYANIDSAQVTKIGAVWNKSSQTIEWPETVIEPYTVSSRVLYFTLKDPIPLTNSPAPTSADYDCVASSNYPTQEDVTIKCPSLKSYEELPSISPIAAVLTATAITLLACVFLVNSKYLHKVADRIHELYKYSGEPHGK